MNAVKMNMFLHRMLKKSSNEELNVEYRSEKEEQRKNEVGRSGHPKGNWIRKLGNYSPSKYQVSASPIRTNTMKALDRSGLSDTYENGTPPRTCGSPQARPEMPDLESIIREFETGFLSPSKQDGAADGTKQKNFVKKIVAAFEVKYKTYNDLKTAQDAQESHEKSKMNTSMEEAPKRKSIASSSPFKSNHDEFIPSQKLDCASDSKQNSEDANESQSPLPAKNKPVVVKRKSRIFGSPFKNASDDVDGSPKSVDNEMKSGNRRSGVFYVSPKNKSETSNSSIKLETFSSPLKNANRSSSEIYSSPLGLERQDSKDSSSDCSSLFKFDKEASSRRSNFHFSSIKMSSLDDTRTMEGIDLDITLPEPDETIFLPTDTFPKTSTMVNELPRNESNLDFQKISGIDKTPKIVGAYLKKPIEVEDTSIDWIPITGKKLPRKRSLKKLLYSLTGRKLEKKNKLFSSERNLSEESREFQDSGYDEKSCSSSSLTSLISITEVLLQQENSYIEANRRAVLKTFKSKNTLDDDEDEAFCDTYSYCRKKSTKQLHLTEVPREDVKLDLGPSYPPSKMVTMSLDRKMVSKKARSPSPGNEVLDGIQKHPRTSKIPKHPFVTLAKMDEPQEFCNSHECRNSQESVMIVKNDMYEVEFRRSCDDLCSSASCRSASLAASHYDIPRRFLSKSESEIHSKCQSNIEQEPIYDVPKPQTIERPRSSVYEDALSLKRRSVRMRIEVSSKIYSLVPHESEPHYATIKPRNTKIYFNSETVRAVSDPTLAEFCVLSSPESLSIVTLLEYECSLWENHSCELFPDFNIT
ncbi:PREDICTED: uncharacterized protein LOC108555794 [Eufriesea mexicana]|uniref:uncharacterized protein LOC108555794 n=1 Tax=Eufriesea mexicana TaxID=516756 RepID=UPI00083BDB6A|nr:PREDICTED: uncharacterized protein LOC108555794 [Eufriesea mexicana]